MDLAVKWTLLLICLWTIGAYTSAQSDWRWPDGSFGSSGLSGFPARSEMACDGYPISLRCPGRDVIQIETGEYGRQNAVTCSALPSEMKNTECSLPEAKDIVEKKCNNKTECSFHVSSIVFPDPCPATHKYLRVTFNCVKFMFGCPGTIIGIGRQQSSAVNVQPQFATWTKDPLYNRDHVFFAPSGQTVHEYSSWNEFLRGSPIERYALQTDMAQSSIVVYDRNLYFVKASSRSVVRYSLITRFRTKEAVIPGPGTTRASLGGDISLAVDESGLWVIYTKGMGVLTISKLDKDRLTKTDTWTTNRRLSDSSHTFIICGVMYSINSATGKIDYSYNTNLKTRQEKSNLNIAFQAFGSRRRTRQPVNASFMSYNPRDQLLYSWDANAGNAIYYKLVFDGQDPAKVPTVRTTTSTTTTTTRRRTLATTRRYKTTRAPVITQPEIVHPVVPVSSDSCQPTTRESITWPETKAGDVAKMSCPDNTGDFATWECVRQPSMVQAAWHVAGPITTSCITWASIIGEKYSKGIIDRTLAFESLANEVEKHEFELNDKSLRFAINLMEEFLENDTPTSSENARKIVKSAGKLSSILLGKSEAWRDTQSAQRPQLANSLMDATEKVGFMYATAEASMPLSMRENDPFVVPSDLIVMKIEVREKLLQQLSSHSMTSFPDDETCRRSENCGGDVIKIPDSEIVGQMGEGPTTIVFAYYDNLGNYLSSGSRKGWRIDSKVISATFKQPHYQTRLSKPAVIVLQHKEPSSVTHQCVYWEYSTSKKSGNWSDAGCTVVKSNKTHTTCECKHLSSFAVLASDQGVTSSPYKDPTLDIVTKIGISVSIVCLVFCVLTFCCFRTLQNDRNSIHKHLCICLLAAEIVFLLGINQTQNEVLCSVVAGTLQYFFLAAFLWMALEAFQLYVLLVEVFESESRWKWYYAIGYGIPLIIVGVSAGVNHQGYGTDDVCWLDIDSGFIWSFVGPIAVIISANLILLSMTVYKMYVNTMSFTDAGKVNSIKASVRGASVLLFLLGITWAFGILWITEETVFLAYLFCVFNAFQGLYIFIFYSLLPKKVRQEYSRCMGRLPCCKSLRADSYVSNSMSFSKQYTPGRFANGSNTGNQQASLNGHNHLRRMWNETVVTPKNSQSGPITTEVAQSRDSARGTNCSHRVGSHHPPVSSANTDQRQRQEDEVFLPPEREIEPRTENVRLLHNQHGEIEYDRLQYYRCPEHYHQEAPRSYSPPGHYHPGVPQQHRHPVTHPSLSPVHDHPRFDPAFHSHPRNRNDISPELEYEPTHPQSNRHDPAHPYYWELDPPLGHHHIHQSSLEENISSGKRDSGISMQHLPPNSMMRRLTNEMQGCNLHRSRDSPMSQPDTDGSSSRPTPPIRSIEDDRIHHLHSQMYPVGSQKRTGPLSEDEGQGSSFEDQEKIYPKPEPAPRCAHHPQRTASPPNRTDKPPHLTADQRLRTSITSDSDDPIVTDCSGSSAGSSFGRQYRRWSSQQQEKLV